MERENGDSPEMQDSRYMDSYTKLAARSILSTDRVEHEQLHAGSDDKRRRHKLEHHGAEPGTTHFRAQHHSSTARNKKFFFWEEGGFVA